MLLIVLTLISGLSFLYYGITFFATTLMKLEFERYNLDKYRKLIGGLQLLGGLGLLIGLLWRPALLLASGGLALLMLIGFGVRLKMKDGFWASLPSFIFIYACWLQALLPNCFFDTGGGITLSSTKNKNL